MSRTCPSCSREVPQDAVACPHCGADLPTSLIGAALPPTIPDTDALRDRLQAALGNGFELGSRLGEGGFGVVYRARDVRLKRDVAVKLLRRELVSTAGFVERFEREAQALAALRHPNIVPVYSIGDKDDMLFLVMPFVSGVTLTDLMRERGRLSLEEAERILKAVGDALSTAHAVGLVHRDIKPDNIMLEGPNRLPLLMDFGIAKTGQTGAGGASPVGLTATGMVMGTPLYMSPEQATADPSVDSRSDIYSLGVLAYQMFTGKLPFEGDSIYAVLSQHLMTPVPEARSVRPDIPLSISEALRRAMAKKPDERFQKVEEFIAALEGRPGARPRRVARPGNRTLLAAANLVLLLALACIVAWKGSSHVARPTIHAELRADAVWLRTAAPMTPWDKALTVSTLGLSGLEEVTIPAHGKKPLANVATSILYLKAFPPESGSISIDPIRLPARSLVVLKPTGVAGGVALTIGDSLPMIPVSVSGRMILNVQDPPADTIAFHIDQIQLDAAHGPLDFDLGFTGVSVARPLEPFDIVGISFEDINRIRDEGDAADTRVSTIDSGSLELTIGNRPPHILKKGEMLPLRGFTGSVRDVTVDSGAVTLTLEGTVDSLPASLGTVPTKLRAFVAEHPLPSAAAGIVYATLLVLIGLYWKRSSR